MAKKVRDDDFEDDFEGDDLDETTSDTSNNSEEDGDSDSSDESEIQISDDDEDIDIVIEIDEDDLDLTADETNKVKEEVEGSEDEDIVLSKHKMEGKHSLKYDSIFKGKKEDPIDELDIDPYTNYYKDTIEVDKSSNYYFESIDNENYIRTKLVKERVYQVLTEHTSINFLNNRRKPSKVDFNQYYELLRINLKEESFTNIELFNELSVYFSDNLFNMFKLLDNKWRNLIIHELQEHIGRGKNSKEITNRNIYVGTEIEFIWSENGEEKHITGDVIETDYVSSQFKVNSYERVYEISINDISKILNNTKFKYNLNKLNNIDFL
jgi:hypothetical protein